MLQRWYSRRRQAPPSHNQPGIPSESNAKGDCSSDNGSPDVLSSDRVDDSPGWTALSIGLTSRPMDYDPARVQELYQDVLTAWRKNPIAWRAEQHDCVQRVFHLSASEVRAEVPEYGAYVDEQVARLGADHALVKTQFFSQEIDGEGGMFTPARRVLMLGDHPALEGPLAGEAYAFLLDVAGQDPGGQAGLQGWAWGAVPGGSGGGLANPGRDATALTIVSADLSQFQALRAPIYRVVARRLWVGVRHVDLFGQLLSLVEGWGPRYVVVDSTGLGAGLASFLERALGGSRLIPFTFTSASKSKLGWDFLSVIETGRLRDHAGANPLKAAFWAQVEACEMDVLDGAGQTLRSGVPEGRRDPGSGELVHDDLLISAALCALLDGKPLGLAESALVQPVDPLGGWGRCFKH